MGDFSDAQKAFLEGVGRGLAVARAAGTASAASSTAVSAPVGAGPESIHQAARERTIAAGRGLTREEEAKRDLPPLDMWDELVANAGRDAFPKGIDVYRYKFHGLFQVAPAQDAFMCRLRIPNGILDAGKFAALADLAERHGGGYADVTTRANLQIREIGAADAVQLLQGLAEAGLTSRGAGADNVRNITGSPTAGIDPVEIHDTRPLGLALHHAILNHRELYGLPRKFNVAFDGGGTLGALEDTNDLGFAARQALARDGSLANVHFRVAVGGITGHGDFAADLGVAIAPSQCTNVATAILRVFIAHGDRSDRKRARLKYVLEKMGREAFLAAVESELGTALPRLSLGECAPRAPRRRGAHAGFHPQRDPHRVYAGVVLPAGRISAAQMRGLAGIARTFGSGALRLTVWQNVIVSDLAASDEFAVESALQAIGLTARASAVRAGMVACTGSAGCKFSAGDTKRDALAIVAHLESRLHVDLPLNIHVTGCPHSCAQHVVGDLGLLATKVVTDDDREIAAYHLYAGGGFGETQGLGREFLRDVEVADVPLALERLLAAWLTRRTRADETFEAFARAHSTDELHRFATTDAGAKRFAA